MKKFKLFLVAILTVIMSVFCLASCGASGTYKVTSYKAGPISIEVEEDNESYIKVKGDEVTMSIKVGSVKLEGTGTCEKGEDNAYVLTIEGVKYNATIEKGVMTINLLGTELILEK
ncbi:MAG: hypothetical protein E7366_01060 [Clostridiales bacterium]|nr:hypothetical protein [Clostridiales bacterium]